MPDEPSADPRSTPLPADDPGETQDLVVVEELEAFEEPAAGDSAGSSEHTEFALDEWSTEDRALVDRLLVGEDIPHTWQGAILVVPTGSQFVVDGLIDAVEAGPDALAQAGWADVDEDGSVDLDDDGLDDDIDAQDVLGSAFVAADRLRKRASDPEGVLALVEVHTTMASMRLPFGFDEDAWTALVDAVAVLSAALTAADGSEISLGDEQIEERADELRARLRPLV